MYTMSHTNWMKANVKKVDQAVSRLPLLHGLWAKIRPEVTRLIECTPDEEQVNVEWPPLFLWLYRYPGAADKLERALAAIKRAGAEGEFRHARSELTSATNYDGAFSRIVEVLVIGRCLEQLPPAEVELHPEVNPPGGKRADLAIIVGEKRVFIEVTALVEREEDKGGAITTRFVDKDGQRILAKVLDKVAADLDVGGSQLSMRDPNVVLLATAAVTGAYDEAFQWAFAALERCAARLRDVVLSRAKTRRKELSEKALGRIVAAFSRISAIIWLQDAAGTCIPGKRWRRGGDNPPLTQDELDRIINVLA